MCYGSGCAFEDWMGECTVLSYSSGIKEYFNMSACLLGGCPSDPETEEYILENAEELKNKRREFYNNKNLFYSLSRFIEKNEKLEIKINKLIDWIISKELHKTICDKVKKCENNCKTCIKENINLFKIDDNYFSNNINNLILPKNKEMTLILPDEDGQMYFVW